MGAGLSSSGANRMAIGAMASATKFEKEELLELQKKFFELAKRDASNPNTITLAEFREALECVGIAESDTEILERLFTLCDTMGTDQIFFKDFVVGLAPLIHGTVEEKLNFSFELYDIDGTGQIRRDEMETVLGSMVATASYFGDPVISTAEVKSLVEDIFKEADVSHTGTLSYKEYMSAVAEHPVLVQFITGQGTERYGGV